MQSLERVLGQAVGDYLARQSRIELEAAPDEAVPIGAGSANFEAEGRAFIDIFSRAQEEPRENVRLLVCGEENRQPTVEVAHEALLREWGLLAAWIRQQHGAFVRRVEVERDAGRWDTAGRPDDYLPAPGVRRDVRRRLQEAGLWEKLREDKETVAYFLAEDDPEELADLTQRAFAHREEDSDASLLLLCCLTAPGAPGTQPAPWATGCAGRRRSPLGCAPVWTRCCVYWDRTTPSPGAAVGWASATCWPPWATSAPALGCARTACRTSPGSRSRPPAGPAWPARAKGRG